MMNILEDRWWHPTFLAPTLVAARPRNAKIAPTRQVANCDGQFELVSQLLKLDFPETHAIPVAAAAVGCDHQTLGFGMALLSHCPPPAADRIDCEAGRIVIRADTDPSDIVGDVVDAVRHGTAQGER